jgi:hypothetical protein
LLALEAFLNLLAVFLQANSTFSRSTRSECLNKEPRCCSWGGLPGVMDPSNLPPGAYFCVILSETVGVTPLIGVGLTATELLLFFTCMACLCRMCALCDRDHYITEIYYRTQNSSRNGSISGNFHPQVSRVLFSFFFLRSGV